MSNSTYLPARALVLALALLGLTSVATGQDLPPVRYVDGAPACPSDLDIRNIDTRLSARVISPANEQTLRAERRKAVQCRQSNKRYSEKEWRRLEAVIRGED